MSKTGKLSINSENMLPIIKKWLYSDHDIFVREQVANACDAITKLRKLEGVGEYRPEEEHKYEVHVVVNPDEKTLKFIDTGIGMTMDEVEKYITQIAFSGANEFLKKYEGKTDQDQIIGHFGLGFYSAFMVADEVHIDTLSYMDGAIFQEEDGVNMACYRQNAANGCQPRFRFRNEKFCHMDGCRTLQYIQYCGDDSPERAGDAHDI